MGVNFGGGWSNGSLNVPGNNLYGGLSEFIGGVQAGYNFQAGHFLFGVEGEFDGAGFAHPVLAAPTLGVVDQRWIGTAAGRIGLERSMAAVRQAWRRLGAQQRYLEPSWHSLERVQHPRRLVSWCWHRIRLQIALDGQTRIRISGSVKLKFSHGPFGGFQPRSPADQPQTRTRRIREPWPSQNRGVTDSQLPKSSYGPAPAP